MAAVAGLRGTGDFAANELPEDFREFILWKNPNGSAVLTALMGKTKKKETTHPHFHWWGEGNDIIRLQVNYGTGYSGSDNTLVVDSPDPDAANFGRVYGLATHLKPGDLLMVEKSEAATIDNEIVMVSSVTSATQLVVKRGQAGTTAAAIADDAYLLFVGSAYSEGTNSPDATARNPVEFDNYCQILKDAYELTGTAQVTETRTGDPEDNDKMRGMFRHSMSLEKMLMFGRKYSTTGANGKPLRFSAGLRAQIPADVTTIFATTPTKDTFLNAVYKSFDFESEAGDERIVIAGNGFLNNLNKLITAAGTVQFGPIVKTYGMNLRQYVLPQGTLFLRTHPLMNRHSVYAYSAFIIDASALTWRFMPGRDTKSKDNVQANDADTKKGMWMTEGGLQLNYGGLTCGYIGNFTIP
jgi:hypothetical protein